MGHNTKGLRKVPFRDQKPQTMSQGGAAEWGDEERFDPLLKWSISALQSPPQCDRKFKNGCISDVTPPSTPTDERYILPVLAWPKWPSSLDLLSGLLQVNSEIVRPLWWASGFLSACFRLHYSVITGRVRVFGPSSQLTVSLTACTIIPLFGSLRPLWCVFMPFGLVQIWPSAESDISLVRVGVSWESISLVK